MPMKEVAAIAQQILARDVDPLVGCRRIARQQAGLSDAELRDEDLLTLVGIESETDEFPLEGDRPQWDAERLAHLDRLRQAYLREVEEALYDACRAIVAKYS